MDSAVAGLVGAIVGAIVGLLGSFLSNLLLIRRERERAIWDRETERQHWLRERLQEIYSNAIHYLSLIVNSHSKILEADSPVLKDEIRAWANDFSEAQKWLGLLLAYYPNRNSKEFNTLSKSIIAFSKSDKPDSWVAKELRDQIIDIASEDSRLVIKEFVK